MLHTHPALVAQKSTWCSPDENLCTYLAPVAHLSNTCAHIQPLVRSYLTLVAHPSGTRCAPIRHLLHACLAHSNGTGHRDSVSAGHLPGGVFVSPTEESIVQGGANHIGIVLSCVAPSLVSLVMASFIVLCIKQQSSSCNRVVSCCGFIFQEKENCIVQGHMRKLYGSYSSLSCASYAVSSHHSYAA